MMRSLQVNEIALPVAVSMMMMMMTMDNAL